MDIKLKSGIIGAVILPSVYLLIIIITKNPDIIVTNTGFFGIIFGIIQWISFLIGGWILAILSTIILLGIIGFLIGLLIGLVIEKSIKFK